MNIEQKEVRLLPPAYLNPFIKPVGRYKMILSLNPGIPDNGAVGQFTGAQG